MCVVCLCLQEAVCLWTREVEGVTLSMGWLYLPQGQPAILYVVKETLRLMSLSGQELPLPPGLPTHLEGMRLVAVHPDRTRPRVAIVHGQEDVWSVSVYSQVPGGWELTATHRLKETGDIQGLTWTPTGQLMVTAEYWVSLCYFLSSYPPTPLYSLSILTDFILTYIIIKYVLLHKT